MGITLTQSDWIALSAMIVAVFALFVTIWDSYQSRKHNRLSVKPFLGIGVDIHEKVEFTLSNQGIGPAVIKEFSVYFDGKLLSKNPRADIYRDLLEGSIGKYKFHIPFEGACIKEGAEKSLLRLIMTTLRKTSSLLKTSLISLLLKLFTLLFMATKMQFLKLAKLHNKRHQLAAYCRRTRYARRCAGR